MDSRLCHDCFSFSDIVFQLDYLDSLTPCDLPKFESLTLSTTTCQVFSIQYFQCKHGCSFSTTIFSSSLKQLLIRSLDFCPLTRFPSCMTPGDQEACGRRRPAIKLERWLWMRLITSSLFYPVAHLRVLISSFVVVLVPVF